MPRVQLLKYGIDIASERAIRSVKRYTLGAFVTIDAAWSSPLFWKTSRFCSGTLHLLDLERPQILNRKCEYPFLTWHLSKTLKVPFSIKSRISFLFASMNLFSIRPLGALWTISFCMLLESSINVSAVCALLMSWTLSGESSMILGIKDFSAGLTHVDRNSLRTLFTWTTTVSPSMWKDLNGLFYSSLFVQ